MIHCKESMKNGIFQRTHLWKKHSTIEAIHSTSQHNIAKVFERDELLNVSRNKVVKEELNGFYYWELENTWIVKKM